MFNPSDMSRDALLDAMERNDVSARMTLRALARRSLYYMTKAVVGFHFHPNLFGVDVFKERQDWIQWVLTEHKRGLLEDPRAHTKSWGSTVAAPIWLAVQEPALEHPEYGLLDHPSEHKRALEYIKARPHLKGVDARYVVAADSVKRAAKWVGPSKVQWEVNLLLRWLFPEKIWPNPKIRTYGNWSNYEYALPGRANPTLTDGYLRAAGIESKEQGGRAEGLFIDDLVGENSYKSDTELEVRRDFIDTIPSLLENNDFRAPQGGFVLVIGNRWALDDVNSKIHDTMPHYSVWRRRAYRCFVHGTGNCGRKPSDEEGDPECRPTDEPLWKEQYPDAQSLENVRMDRGDKVFAAQWLNDPTADSDLNADLIKPFIVDLVSTKDFRGWVAIMGQRETATEGIPLRSLTQHVISVDPASSRESRAARSSIVWEAVDRATRRRFVLEVRADRYGPDETIKQVLDLWTEARIKTEGQHVTILCEKVAAQDYVASNLRAAARLNKLPVPDVQMVPVPKGASKEDRQRRRIGNLLGNGLLCVRFGLPLVWHEVRHFPSGTKDVLDCIAQAEEVFQDTVGTIDSDALRARRKRRREARLQASTSTGAPL